MSLMKKKRKELMNPISYILDGFTYAFQIWAMEAIPALGELVGEKINKEQIEGPRRLNWGAAPKISYDDLITVENSFLPADATTTSSNPPQVKPTFVVYK